MAKYVCSICGFAYDEANGIPEDGIAEGTKWEDLPEDWVCPVRWKIRIRKTGESALVSEEKAESIIDTPSDMKELSP